MSRQTEPAATKCVLVVDDDDSSRSAMILLLEISGFRVASAANGQEALSYLRGNPPPDVILLDLMMPVMDGWQFCQQLQREPALAGIPVILVSADTQVDEKARRLALPAQVQKPVDIDELVAAVRRHT